MSALLPRPVGVASQDEVLVVEVNSDEDAAGLSKRLAPQMPYGIRLLSIDKPFHYDPRQSLAVEYAMQVEPTMHGDISQRIEALMSQTAVIVERSSPKYAFKKPVDIRHYLLSMELVDNRLTWTQLVECDGSVRIGEVLEALGMPSRDYIARVTRERVADKR